MMKKRIRTGAALCCALLLGLTGCVRTAPTPTPGSQPSTPTESVSAGDLMDGITPTPAAAKPADEAFLRAQMSWAVSLFRAAASSSREENPLLSPLSVQLALTMTANGAVGQTRSEMETLLGGGLPLEELNAYLHSYVETLSSEATLANSIWFRDDENRLRVEPSFLQTNADYYRAQVYRAPFDDGTLRDINRWVAEQTAGRIDRILEKIHPNAVIYLINALVFDAEWETVYKKTDISEGVFIAETGERRAVEMMHAAESRFLDDGRATGFIRDYKGGRYRFAALLPNAGIDLDGYIAGLTADGLLDTLQNATASSVETAMPKFQCAYELQMNELLAAMGMPTAFDSAAADFSEMAVSSHGNIFIGNVLHKTCISVDELGTKAGAVTSVEMEDKGMPLFDRTVILDRPFLYMILDGETNLPLFIGAVRDIPAA